MNCVKGRLSPPWPAQTKIACFAECQNRFQDRCRNVVYNTHTHACAPVHPKSRDDPVLDSEPGDVLYSRDTRRSLVCDSAAGFQLYHLCGAAVCILSFSVTLNYQNATAECAARNSKLFMPNTFERFALLEVVSPEYTWAGLTKVGDAWVWESGDAVETDFYNFMWSSGQPNGPEERCGALTYDVFLDKLHDWPCVAQHRFVCEQSV
ncbi:vitelline coat lysin M7 [Elysia marginata]|uniref:Vitelline coat lysin M7 n=1 Tax=Elysia marginata TaxID=1093978 RepID=A0AAV4F0R5_9GAST|nr:vitelline coat lysin M7 [Elysia marginata]